MANAYDLAALRVYLLADSTINTLTGGRVYNHMLPKADAKDMPRKAVVLNDAGGSGRLQQTYADIGWTQKDVRCYGETNLDARTLFMAVHRRLKQLRRTLVAVGSGQPAVLLYSASPSNSVTSLVEPETEWPLSFGTYEVMSAEEG